MKVALKSVSMLAVVLFPMLVVGCVLTPEPDRTLERIKRDHMAEQLLLEADGIESELGAYWGYKQHVRLYVPVYMAKVCVEGSQPFVEDFNTFTRRSLSAGQWADSEAVRVIKAIEDAHVKWKSGSLDAATQHCLQPYLYPKSVSDAAPAVELSLAARVIALPWDLRDGFESLIWRSAPRWFQTDQQEPFLSWCC